MINRQLEPLLTKSASQYPVITITGPRQSGKTTLAKSVFPDKKYVNLELPNERQFAIDDPLGFLNKYPKGAILDEIQRTPQLPSYIQGIVDESNISGMFVLTGSQQLEISQSISQSLAGRTAIAKLLPLSLQELFSYKTYNNAEDIILKGFYPRLHTHSIEPFQYYSNYFQTYVERDLRQLSQIDNLLLFERFVRLIAGRIGQLLNYNSIANDLGVSQPTIKKWISILEASFIIFLLPPYFSNIGKRLIKTPKLYFYDTGLASFLLNIESEEQLFSHPCKGNLFENLVILEFIKQRFNVGKPSNCFFFRDVRGNEVDLVLDNAGILTPIEIKSSQTASTDFTRSLSFFKTLFPNSFRSPQIIYTGKKEFSIHDIHYHPWSSLAK